MMHDWIYLSKQMINHEAEMMIIPTFANVLYKPRSPFKKTLYFTFDLFYYIGRAYIIR